MEHCFFRKLCENCVDNNLVLRVRTFTCYFLHAQGDEGRKAHANGMNYYKAVIISPLLELTLIPYNFKNT